MVAVLVIHTTAYFAFMSGVNALVIVNDVLDNFFQFAVPVFVLASGLALSFRYRGPFAVTRFYGRRLQTVIPPYLAFSVFYTLYAWGVSGVPPILHAVFSNLLLGNAFYHLWFIVLIVQLYLLFPLLSKLLERCPGWAEIWIPVGFLALQVLYNMFVAPLEPIANSRLATLVAGRLFLGYIGYFVAGMYMGRHMDRVRARVRLPVLVPLIVGSVMLTAVISVIWLQGIQEYGNYYDVPASYLAPIAVLQPLLCLSVFFILVKWSMSTNSRLVGLFGDYSLWVYLVHAFFLAIMVDVAGSFGLDYTSWVFYPVAFAGTFVLCLLSCIVLKHVPGSHWVGRPRPVETTGWGSGSVDPSDERAIPPLGDTRPTLAKVDGDGAGSQASGGGMTTAASRPCPESSAAPAAAPALTGGEGWRPDHDSDEMLEGL